MSPEVVPQIKSKGNARLLEEPLTALFCSPALPWRPHTQDLRPRYG